RHYLMQFRKLEGEESIKNDYYVNIASKYYLDTKQYDSLISISVKKLAIGERQNNMILQIGANRSLSEAYEGKKDYKKALSYFIKAYNMENDVENLINKDEVGLMQMQKQQEIMEEALNEQKKAQEAERKRIQFQNRVRLYGLLGGILILII